MYLGLPEKVAITALVAVTLTGSLMLYGSYKYKQGVADTKQEQYVAQLEQFKQQTFELDRASKQLLTITQRLDVQAHEWKFNYDEIASKEPLHPDCVITPSRLRTINTTIEQAAATRKSSNTLPPDREVD